MSKRNNEEENIKDNLQQIISFVPDTHYFKVHRSTNIVIPELWKTKNHCHDDMNLIFTKSGHGEYIFKDNHVSLEKGTILIIGSNVKHDFIRYEKNPAHIVGIRFGLYSHSDSQMMQPLKNLYHSFVTQRLHDYVWLFDKLNEVFYGKLLYSEKEINAILLQILIQMIHDLSREVTQNPAQNNVYRLKKHLDAHPYNRYCIEDMAEIAGLSPKYFAKIFKEQYHISPLQYHITLRMKQAKYLLEESGMNVSEVAHTFQFADASTFSKQFKLKMGIWPNEVINKK